MSYELNAEGTNGVRLETTVVALDGFASEFGISVWNVDATAAPSIDAIWGFTSRGAVGVRGRSTLNGVGVRGEVTSGTGDGVQGQGSGSFSGVAGFGGSGESGDGTGLFGQGGGATGPGVRGIGAGAANTSPSTAVGVYGQGAPDADGVQGVGGGVEGGGVHGISQDVDGNGVIGEANNGVDAYAIWGQSISGFAGVFDGTVQVNWALNVTGAKSAVNGYFQSNIHRLSEVGFVHDFG